MLLREKERKKKENLVWLQKEGRVWVCLRMAARGEKVEASVHSGIGLSQGSRWAVHHLHVGGEARLHKLHNRGDSEYRKKKKKHQVPTNSCEKARRKGGSLPVLFLDVDSELHALKHIHRDLDSLFFKLCSKGKSRRKQVHLSAFTTSNTHNKAAQQQ